MNDTKALSASDNFEFSDIDFVIYDTQIHSLFCKFAYMAVFSLEHLYMTN